MVYDEKPLTLGQSWNQRKRWMQGFADVSSRYFIPLMENAFKRLDFISFDCALYTIQPYITLLLGVSILLAFVQNNSPHGLNIFVINNLLPVFVWKIFSIFQFLFTPFVMILESKLKKPLFGFLGLYSLNIVISGLIFGSHGTFIQIALESLMYFCFVSTLIYIVLGKNSTELFFRYILYGVYTLTWIPITIQGIMNKNDKEWSHTKHTRQIGMEEMRTDIQLTKMDWS